MKNNDISPIITTPSSPVMQGKGYFTIGSLAVFFFEFPDVTGDRYDPINITAIIKDGNDQIFATLDSDQFDKLEIGKYALSWSIPTTDPNSIPTEAGVFTITLNFTAETVDGSMDLVIVNSFVVGNKDNSVIPTRMIGARSHLESLIGNIQKIPVFHETGRLNHARNVAEFSFPRWNAPRVKVYINGEVKESGYYVNYIDGKILLDHPLASTDEIFASYTFRWIEDDELHAFIAQGIEIFNQYPPQTTYGIDNVEDRWIITAIKQAAVDVLRRMILDIGFQEPAKIFGGMDRADKLMSTWESIKQNYEAEINKLYEMKKYGPYKGLTMTITTPEYTLPGGRSRWFRYLFKG